MDGKRASCRLLECLIIFLLVNCVSCISRSERVVRSSGWNWKLLMNNTGVVAMHMAVTHHNKVVMFDQTQAGPSEYPLRRRRNGQRCHTPDDFGDSSCYAHSVEYNVLKNRVRALHLMTDAWCSSGSFLSNGSLLQTGGNGVGSRKVRYYRPCMNGRCDWMETKKKLLAKRWYASSLYLPRENGVMVVGGESVFSYEFVPKILGSRKAYDLPLLHRTYERNSKGNNLYPFLHLSNDGHVFIFANRDSILFNYKRHKVMKKFPRIPGKGGRSYPSTGSSVILPLDHSNHFNKVEIMICGGAVHGAYAAAQRRRFVTGLRSCGRMVITGNHHKWRMENMPGPRLMSDMVILPTGNILIVNGAKRGCAGWNSGSTPAFEPYLYQPNHYPGQRFKVLKRTKIARMYHSSAVLLPDGRILIAGGNPNKRYMFHGVAHPTELRLQALIPDYMSHRFDKVRPINVTVVHPRHSYGVSHGHTFSVNFHVGTELRNLSVVAYAPPFTTHSVSMNQRLVKLNCSSAVRGMHGRVQVSVEVPSSIYVVPPGYYMVTVVNGGIPSKSSWVRII